MSDCKPVAPKVPVFVADWSAEDFKHYSDYQAAKFAYVEPEVSVEDKWDAYNSQFEEPLSDVPRNDWGHYGEYVLVGQDDKPTNDKCGKFGGYYGCLNSDLHDLVTLDFVTHPFKGLGFFKKHFYSCDSPTCPICFKRGWAVRGAEKIEERLRGFDKRSKWRFGKTQHIVVSVPQSDYGLSFEKLKDKVIHKVLKSRRVLGGVAIFHAFRYRNWHEARRVNQPVGWYFSPHFHVLGYIDNFAKCRGCENRSNGTRDFVFDTEKCLVCDGFEGLERRCFREEAKAYCRRANVPYVDGVSKSGGYIVSVKGERKTVFGTAWYQLNHCSIVNGTKRKCYRKNSKTVCSGKSRFHATYWFGVCSYTELKLEKGDRFHRDTCPICGYELVRVKYVGVGEPEEGYFANKFKAPIFDSRGVPLWIVVGGSSKGGRDG
jgi:hypothetical protein